MENFKLESFLAGCGEEYYNSIDEITMDMFEESLDYLTESWMETGISDETLEGFDDILEESGLKIIDSQSLWESDPSLAMAYEDVKDKLLVSCVAQKGAKKVMNGVSFDPDQILAVRESIDYIRECQRANKVSNTQEDDKETQKASRYIGIGEDYHTLKNQTRRAYGDVKAVHEKASELISSVKKH